MRKSAKEVIAILGTDYIDSKLKDLSYCYITNTLSVRYGDINCDENDGVIIFQGCFSVSINHWLEGIEGAIPQHPKDMACFFHDITIEDIMINKVELCKCSMIIPMLDCQITCVSIEIS